MNERCLIERTAFGGEGVARKNGLVLFVPFTLPGDIVDVEIRQKKSNFARAELRTILKKSPDRQRAPCPYFTVCGGCQLQHATYASQLRLKRGFVQDALERIGKIRLEVPEVLGSTKPFGYRRHISLKIGKREGRNRLGFSSVDRLFAPVDSCLLLDPLVPDPEENPVVCRIADVIADLDESLSGEERVKIIKGERGYVIAFVFPRRISEKSKNALLACRSCEGVAGGIVKNGEEEIPFGDVRLEFVCEGLRFAYSPFSFVQNHSEQSNRIYKETVESLRNEHKILDLYCGIGVSTLLLAREGKEVLGIEIDPTAVDLARSNAEVNGIENALFSCRPAEVGIGESLRTFQPEALLVNPPKAGLSREVLEAFSVSDAKKIVYVSCHPASLARDLAGFTKRGFAVESLKVYDMFPQTTHVETLVTLHRK